MNNNKVFSMVFNIVMFLAVGLTLAWSSMNVWKSRSDFSVSKGEVNQVLVPNPALVLDTIKFARARFESYRDVFQEPGKPFTQEYMFIVKDSCEIVNIIPYTQVSSQILRGITEYTTYPNMTLAESILKDIRLGNNFVFVNPRSLSMYTFYDKVIPDED